MFERNWTPIKRVGNEKCRIGGQQEGGDHGGQPTDGSLHHVKENEDSEGLCEDHGKTDHPGGIERMNLKTGPENGDHGPVKDRLQRSNVGHDHQRNVVMEYSKTEDRK